MAKFVVAIAREFGSGGRAIGKRLAEMTGVPFVDKELIKDVCEHGIDNSDIIEIGENRRPQVSAPMFGRSMVATFYQPSFSDQIFIDQAKAIKAIADEGSCIIVGRCADYVLRDYENCVKVFISASMKHKIERKRSVAPEKAEYSDQQMEKYVKEIDKSRSKYYEHYTGLKKGQAENYDICIKTDLLDTEAAATIIYDYLKGAKLI